MFSGFRAIRLWLQSLRAYRSGDYRSAMELAERSIRLDGHPNAYQLAFYGTLLVLNHRSQEAKQVFNAASAARPGRSADGAYVKAYAAYYLELIGRGDQAEGLWQQALSQRQTRFTRRYLSLPAVAIP
jgi:tetratricopeptide (TPR) repeat protein